MTPFLQLPPPREAQQVDAFMRTRHHRRQRRLPSLFRLRPSFGRDRNYRRRTLLILALATDNTAAAPCSSSPSPPTTPPPTAYSCANCCARHSAVTHSASAGTSATPWLSSPIFFIATCTAATSRCCGRRVTAAVRIPITVWTPKSPSALTRRTPCTIWRRSDCLAVPTATWQRTSATTSHRKTATSAVAPITSPISPPSACRSTWKP